MNYIEIVKGKNAVLFIYDFLRKSSNLIFHSKFIAKSFKRDNMFITY